jgi:hypothetical protein
MKRFFLFLFLSITTISLAQEDAWVYFKDKYNAQTYFDTPLKMLSQRAIDRRTNQNIALDLVDIPIDKEYISQIKMTAGITVLAKSKWLNALHVRGTQAAINSLKAITIVDKVDFANKNLNGTTRIGAYEKGNRVRQAKSIAKTAKTAVNYDYGTASNQIVMLKGDVLHQQNFTGSGKIIAILDGGFPGVDTALPFARLRENNQILGGYDFVGRSEAFYTSSSHGTSVLSTMGGYVANSFVGTAPDASYYLFITEADIPENPVEESLWVEAAERADSLGVDIINSSLGYFEFDNRAYDHTYAQMDGKTAFISRGAEIAFSRGMMVVVSAGNSGNSSNPHIAAPADAASVLSIGAVNSSKSRVGFSSIGPSIDNRIKPDVMAQGQATAVSDQTGKITTANGTSFSSPVLAGMVACLWQALPTKTNKEIRQIIIASADRFTSPDNQYGYGIPNFSAALNKGLATKDFSESYFYMYPNPTTDYVTFPESFNTGKIIFYTVLGQKVLEKNISGEPHFISLQSLQSGLYLYTFEADAIFKSGKILKY